MHVLLHGNGTRLPGQAISPEFEERLNTLIEWMKEPDSPVEKAFFFAADTYGSQTAAEIVTMLAFGNGIPMERLHVESKARTTREEVACFAARAEGREAGAVTSLYHQPRSSLLMDEFGFPKVAYRVAHAAGPDIFLEWLKYGKDLALKTRNLYGRVPSAL